MDEVYHRVQSTVTDVLLSASPRGGSSNLAVGCFVADVAVKVPARTASLPNRAMNDDGPSLRLRASSTTLRYGPRVIAGSLGRRVSTHASR